MSRIIQAAVILVVAVLGIMFLHVYREHNRYQGTVNGDSFVVVDTRTGIWYQMVSYGDFYPPGTPGTMYWPPEEKGKKK